MRTRLAIVFCSLVAICAIGLIFIPSSESSVSKPDALKPQPVEFNVDMVQNHPKGYHLKSVTYEDKGRPADPKEVAEKVARIHEKLKAIEEKQKKM